MAALSFLSFCSFMEVLPISWKVSAAILMACRQVLRFSAKTDHSERMILADIYVQYLIYLLKLPSLCSTQSGYYTEVWGVSKC